MKRETQLRERDWWWTWPTKDRKYNPEFHTIDALTPAGKEWKSHVERAAQRYELMRRGDRTQNADPFNRLPPEEIKVVIEAFVGAREPAAILLPHDDDSERETWSTTADVTNFFELHLLVRSDASQAEAEQEIAGLLKARKAALGLHKRRRSGKGAKGNHPSWLRLELLDLEYHGRKHFNRSEQQILRTAQAAAAECLSAWLNFLNAD